MNNSGSQLLPTIQYDAAVGPTETERRPKKQKAVVLHPLRIFPSGSDTLTKAFFSASLGSQRSKLDRLESGKKWLHPLKADSDFGIQV